MFIFWFLDPSSEKEIILRSEETPENLAASLKKVEDQIMIEGEVIEEEVKSDEKDDFSMDPIFNEIIEPSLRITSGKRWKYFLYHFMLLYVQ